MAEDTKTNTGEEIDTRIKDKGMREITNGLFDIMGANKQYREERKLVFVIADDNGEILWDYIKITPYTFRQNFLLGGFGIISEERISEEFPEYIVRKDISEKMREESINQLFDPLKQIEARKHGIILGASPFCSEFYYNGKIKKGGYLFIAHPDQITYLSEAGIEHLLVNKSENK